MDSNHGGVVDKQSGGCPTSARAVATDAPRAVLADALRESQERFRVLVETINDWVWEMDEQSRYTYCSPKCRDLLGYDPQELLGRTPFDLMPPDEAARVRARRDQYVERHAAFSALENVNIRKDGRRVVLETSGVPVFDAAGTFCGYRGSDRDVTDRKRAEQDHARLIAAVEQNSEMVVITDIGGRIQYVNPAFERVTGYSAHEVLGANPRILKSGRHDEAYYREMWAALAAGSTWKARFVNRRKDGSVYPQDNTIFPVKDAAGRTTQYVCLGRDVTREDDLEQQLRQAQKLEAVGRLAGGVAHDFNNLLTVILGECDLTLPTLRDNDPLGESLREIRAAGQRGAALTRQLLAFSRKQIVEPTVFSPNDLVRDVEKMLRRLIGEDIAFAVRLAPDLGPIEADRGQVEQVLVNIVVNARDAMPNGGHLTIETSNQALDEASCEIWGGATPGEYAVIAVGDTGLGMSDEVRARAFEPFFTTKGPGRGTGLGLSTCYGIVSQLGGHIRVYSEVGVGTTMRICLPRTTAAAPARGRANGTIPRGTETLLLVEDDAPVRTLATRILEGRGYRVLSTGDPREALALFVGRPDGIDAVVTDVVLPGMSGRDLVDEIRRVRPGLPAMFMSGYIEDTVLQRRLLDMGDKLLPKPFTVETLATKVRQVLDGA